MSNNELRAKCLVEMEKCSEDEILVALYRVRYPNSLWSYEVCYKSAWIGIATRYELVAMLDQMDAFKDAEKESVDGKDIKQEVLVDN